MLPEQIKDKVVSEKIPIDVQFELTWRCNQRCVHCYQYDPQEDILSTDQIKNIILQLKEAGTLYISFTGGEPLLRPDFWEIAQFANDHHFALILQTNAVLIDEKAAEKIAQLNFFTVHISLLGANSKTHDDISQIPGSFDKTMRAARLLTDRGVRVVLNLTLLKQNFGEYNQVKALKEQLGSDIDIRISPYVFYKNNGDSDPARFRLDDRETRDFFLSERERSGGSRLINRMLMCNFGYSVCLINARGEVYPCVAVPVVAGDLKCQSFKDIWEESLVFKAIRARKLEELVECGKCSLSEWCFRCSGFSYLESGDMFGCSSEAKRVAKIVREVNEYEKAEV
ncbi:radical SAM/SPASM domain-containing protein [Candidatus Margulisiibacteriota bacterium]